MIILILWALLYMLPSIVAYYNWHKNGRAIMILNILLGWTVLVWIIALVWASTNNREKV